MCRELIGRYRWTSSHDILLWSNMKAEIVELYNFRVEKVVNTLEWSIHDLLGKSVVAYKEGNQLWHPMHLTPEEEAEIILRYQHHITEKHLLSTDNPKEQTDTEENTTDIGGRETDSDS